MFDTPPDPIALQLGPLTIGWYGICYALGLAAAYFLMVRLARKAGEDPDVVGNGIIVVALAALVGGRLYHVIDKWGELYASDPIKVILPPYAGLGVYGGIVAGTLAAYWYARRRGVSFARWADIIAPALFVMQAIGRWGNFFNQELYGPPTSLPWGIPIECAYRLQDFTCDKLPEATTRFHPLFLYESLSGVLGAIFLVYLGFRLRARLRAGDLLLVFFIWYGATRFVLEFLREDNWTFFDVPVAQIVSLAFIVIGIGGLLVRHNPNRPPDRPAANPQVQTWGAIGATWMTKPSNESWANVGPFRDADEPDEDDDLIDDDALDDDDATIDSDAPDADALTDADVPPDADAPPDADTPDADTPDADAPDADAPDDGPDPRPTP